MKSFRVISAIFDAAQDRIEVVKEVTENDLSTHLQLHVFGADTLEWRAATYGIDDVDELVDIVLVEPYIDDIDPLSVTQEVALSTSRARRAEFRSRNGVVNGANGARKAADRLKLQTAGVPQKYIDAIDNNAFVVIKDHSIIEDEPLQVKREYTSRKREQLIRRESQTDLTKNARPSRADQLRQMLEPRQAGRPSTEKPTSQTSTVLLHRNTPM